jgi:3-methyladenine DNA glycosylase/8-oxoguanine DNA glycosylase
MTLLKTSFLSHINAVFSTKILQTMMTTTVVKRHQKQRCCYVDDRKNDSDPTSVVDGIFGDSPSITKSGWCLREGLTHIMTVDNGRMMSIVRQYGLPMMYELTTTTTTTISRPSSHKQICRHENSTSNDDDDENLDQLKKQPQNCFQSLCRIVAGQQLAGAAAKTVWNRLQQTTEYDLTPRKVLQLASEGMEQYLQKPAGLSKAKAVSIVALAKAFEDPSNGDEDDHGQNHGVHILSDTFLTTAEDAVVREALLRIKGIGPWSCDMFMMFYLERPNILPTGDLGVRKGLAKFFQLRGKAKGGSLCPKNDLLLMEKTLQPYRPYQSLVAYYMWKVADTKDFYPDDSRTNGTKRKQITSTTCFVSDVATPIATSTPQRTVRTRRNTLRHVTP